MRWLLWIADGFPYFLPLVGFIVGLTTVGHRRVGDMVAKTFVVRSSAVGAPIVVPGLTAPAPPTTYADAGTWGSEAPPWTATGAPADPAASGWAAPGAASPTPSADGPQWDAARNTYIQWDPAQSRWLQWDESERTWSVIPGQ